VQTNGQVDPAPANAGPPVLELLEDLRGRRAVVTGAARGIGEAIAKRLIMAGADVPRSTRTPSSLVRTSTRRTWSAWPTS
jgi:short chain dehydrogenase